MNQHIGNTKKSSWHIVSTYYVLAASIAIITIPASFILINSSPHSPHYSTWFIFLCLCWCYSLFWGFPGGSDGKKKNLPAMQEAWVRSRRSPREGDGNPIQYSCLENPTDRGAWWTTVNGVAKHWTQLTFSLSHLHSRKQVNKQKILLQSFSFKKPSLISQVSQTAHSLSFTINLWKPGPHSLIYYNYMVLFTMSPTAGNNKLLS